MLDVIRLEHMRADCIIGVHQVERERAQPIELSIEVKLNLEEAARHDALDHTYDYATLSREVDFILQHGQFQLLETAAFCLCRYLLLPAAGRRADAAEVHVSIRKPHAEGVRGLPSVEVRRQKSEVDYEVESKPFGTVDVVFETSHVGLYRLNIAPDCEIPLHLHHQMSETELILGDNLLCQDQPVEAGRVFTWAKGAAHRYRNVGRQVQSILCIDRPPFIAADEVVVKGTPAPLPTPDPS